MKRIFIIIVIVFIGIIKIDAQSKLDFKKVNELSLIYYYSSEWDSLINIGAYAEKANIDYYYLNYRMAVAYFYKENYFASTYYFEKSLKQNSEAIDDDFFRLIYYKAILFSKQNNKVLKISRLHDTIFDVYSSPYKAEIDLFYLNGNAKSKIGNKNLRMTAGNNYSETYYQQSISMFGFGSNFLLNKNVGIDFRYSNSKLGMIAAIEDEEYFYIRNFSVNQNSVNIKPSFYIGNNQRIDVFIGGSFLKSDVFGPLDTTKSEYGFTRLKTINYAGGLSYNYRYKNIELGLSSVFSSYSAERNIQIGLSLLWYPFGNLNLYSLSEVSVFNTIVNKPRLIIYEKFGFKAMAKLWVEFSGFYGDVRNYSMISSNYSFEIANHTLGIASTRIIYTINTKVDIFASGQYWWRYTDKNELDINGNKLIKTIDYQQLNFIGGLKWNF